jgi:YHS domain-containing protein
MMRFLLLFFWLWFFYLLWRFLLRPRSRRENSVAPEKSATGEEMVQDPHCGTYVPLSLGLKKVIDGRSYYFCSEDCRSSFKPSPD